MPEYKSFSEKFSIFDKSSLSGNSSGESSEDYSKKIPRFELFQAAYPDGIDAHTTAIVRSGYAAALQVRNNLRLYDSYHGKRAA